MNCISKLETDSTALHFLHRGKVRDSFRVNKTTRLIVVTDRISAFNKKIKTPITLIAAKKDILFPGGKMIKRGSKIFPSLKKTILLEHSKHVQSVVDNERIEKIILNSAN